LLVATDSEGEKEAPPGGADEIVSAGLSARSFRSHAAATSIAESARRILTR
jgi:hypothetical protein